MSDHGINSGNIIYSKGYPYQGSIKISSVYSTQATLIAGTKKSVTQLVKIQDAFSFTCRAWWQVKKLETDGKSVRQLFGEFAGWLNEFHGEYSLGEIRANIF